MCLLYNEKATEEMKKRLAKAPVTFYKGYDIIDGRAISPFRNKIVKVIDGCICSNRTSTKPSPGSDGAINLGIHVCCHKKSAQAMISNRDCEFIVPVTGQAEDFVAVGEDDDAVFTKIHVDAQKFAALVTAAAKKHNK